MEWVETTGRSVEDALEAALDQLGVDESDTEFEVISEPKLGLFGRVKSEARIRARVRPTAPRSKEGGGQRKRRGRDKPSSNRGGSPRSEQAAQTEPKEAAVAEKAEKKTAPTESTDEERPGSRGRKGRRGNEGVTEVDHEVALEQQGEIAKEFLGGLLTEANSTATIEVRIDEDDEIIYVTVQGPELGHLIGPRGQALNSLQELTRTVVQRKTGARNGRLNLDVAQYREKRREALERFSRKVADEVRASGVQRILEPMSSADRKVVHDIINEIDGVTTSSEGEDPRRRVVIHPVTD
jgi:spoIIIJ-associated protein